MDRLIYTAMTGTANILARQDTIASNLANLSTTGYRSTIDAFKAIPLQGPGLPTRTFAVNSGTGYDYTPAVLQQTGRSLDVGLPGKGWISVILPNGKEGYTRDGSLQVAPDGTLKTQSGYPVVDDNGQGGPLNPISIPPDTRVTIGDDGTITTNPPDGAAAQITVVGRLKLVNPPESQLVRGEDGLFRTRSGQPAVPDATVSVVPGTLEGSNVSAIGSMVDMISISRQFQMQMQMLKTASDNAQQAAQLLLITG